MRQRHAGRVGVLLRSLALCCGFAIAICVFNVWRYERSPGLLPPFVRVTPKSPIRSIDFKNFTYPEIGGGGTFTLQDGYEPNVEDRRFFVAVLYGDVTADGHEDAMVIHSQNIRGSAIPHFVYVYSTQDAQALWLWSFETGDRGDGGLRQIFADNGRMVVELYGRDRAIAGGTSVAADNDGLCCPPFFTRSTYEWSRGRFRLQTKEPWLANPQGDGSYKSPFRHR